MSRIAPCEERRLRHLELLEEIKAHRGEKAYFQALGKLAKDDYWLFLTEVLMYDWMDPWFHGEEICGFLAKTEGETRLVLSPRGSGKTGCITVPRAAWYLAQDPTRMILVANARDDRAGKMTRASAAIVSDHVRYRMCFPDVVPSSKWSKNGYFVERRSIAKGAGGTERVDPSLMSYGIKGNITGSHGTDMFLDDPINREMVKFPAQMRVAEDFFNESLNCVEPNGNYIISGTRWTYQDIYGKLISGEITGNSGKVKVLKLGASRYIRGQEVLVWEKKKYFDRATQRYKQAGYTWEYLDSRRKNLGTLFSALYYNEPVVDADRQFDTALIKTYKRLPFETGPSLLVGIESESQSGSLAQAIALMARQELRRMRIEALRSHKVRKQDRIRTTLQPLIAAGRFNMPEHLWRAEDSLGEELRTFDKGTDDCLDACTYCVQIAKEAKGQDLPPVYIAVDPAFSTESYSDYTAIVAGCFYRDEFWVLDVDRFKTDRTDIVARRIFRMFDRYRLGFKPEGKKSQVPLVGFGSKAPGLPSSNSFDVDIDLLMEERDGRGD